MYFRGMKGRQQKMNKSLRKAMFGAIVVNSNTAEDPSCKQD